MMAVMPEVGPVIIPVVPKTSTLIMSLLLLAFVFWAIIFRHFLLKEKANKFLAWVLLIRPFVEQNLNQNSTIYLNKKNVKMGLFQKIAYGES